MARRNPCSLGRGGCQRATEAGHLKWKKAGVDYLSTLSDVIYELSIVGTLNQGAGVRLKVMVHGSLRASIGGHGLDAFFETVRIAQSTDETDPLAAPLERALG